MNRPDHESDKPQRLGRATENAMGMSDSIWDRHANPCSGWTRVPVLPLLGIAIWARVWIGWWCLIPAGALCVWVWLNPRVFAPTKSADNWMTQGVLGERIWLASDVKTLAMHHRRAIRCLVAISGLGAITMLIGLVILNPTLAVSGCAVSVLGKLWFIDRMVWIYHDHQGEPQP